MKNLITISSFCFLFAGILWGLRLDAQNTDVVITDFKAFSFYTNGTTADSIFFNPEAPAPGPVNYTGDSLEVFTKDGTFLLNYTPTADSAFLLIWVDLNGDGNFEKNEQIYSGVARGGRLSDALTLPVIAGSHQVLLAISKDPANLTDTQKILENKHVSSLQFTIRAAPPKLTMTSKKETRDTGEVFCMTVPLELESGTGFPCFTINEWSLTYPASITIQVNSNVTQLPGSTPFGIGTMVFPGQIFDLELDISGLPINDGDLVEFTCYYAYCTDSTQVDSVSFLFTKDCMTTSIQPKENDPDQAVSLVLRPNPVREEAIIEYELFAPGRVQLSIWDINGHVLEEIHTATEPAGKHQIRYTPDRLAPGIYLLTLQTSNQLISKKMVILSP